VNVSEPGVALRWQKPIGGIVEQVTWPRRFKSLAASAVGERC
jgi:hypothetical protein